MCGERVFICSLVAAYFGNQLALGLPVNAQTEDRLLVNTTSGRILGARKNVLGESIDAFLGIPFARPPLGDLRFRKPRPVDPWKGVFNATRLPNSCQQEVFNVFADFRAENDSNPNTNISEDCLYLNIWVPSKLRGTKNATVLLWIHGGAYVFGTSSLPKYDGGVLASKNGVIIASTNYRLGVFGFLYLGHEQAPGNMGLYDQALAIQWIKDNVAAFGGDPDSITLFGQSAGAGAVSAHLLSPVTGNLFQRAVIESGSINTPWGFITPERAKSSAVDMVDTVGCNSSLVDVDTPSVMKCMREADAETLSLFQYLNTQGMLDIHWAPTMDGAFIPSRWENLSAQANFTDKDIMVGTNKDEGSALVLYSFLDVFNKDLPTTNVTKDLFSALVDRIFKDSSDTERSAIKNQYLSFERDSPELFPTKQKTLTDLVGDFMFICPMNRFAQALSDRGANVFYYHFTQRSSNSPWGEWMGVVHGDEIDYIFGRPLNPVFNFTKEETNLSARIMSYVTNFAKTGRPTEPRDSWPTYSRKHPNYVVFHENPSAVVHGALHPSACTFWNEKLPALRAQTSVRKPVSSADP